jgi:hypothetical protein
MVDDFDRRHATGRVAVNKSLGRLLQAVRMDGGNKRQSSPTENGQGEGASHGNVQSQGICHFARRNSFFPDGIVIIRKKICAGVGTGLLISCDI